MGAVCACGPERGDISTFWRGLELRKITFDAYCKIYEKNQINWLNSGDNNHFINLRKCDELNKLLYNSDFTADERDLLIENLNEFVNKLSDKLTFFTCLSFFTILNEDNQKNKKSAKQSFIESLRSEERVKHFDIVFESLLKMAIKKNDHEDVTKLFIELVTVFPVNFLYTSLKAKEEILAVYSSHNREILFNQISRKNKKIFYEYMFNKDNVWLIHNDLMKIHANIQNVEITKITKTSNEEDNHN